MNKEQIIYVDGKPYIKCNIVMLFSPKGGNLFSIEDSELIKYSEKVLYENILHQIHPFNLYITSNEKLSKGEWYCSPMGIISRYNGIEKLPSNWRKIIATTEESSGLPQLSLSFIEKYIEEYNKGNIITEILVEVEELKTCIKCGAKMSSHYLSCQYPVCEGILIQELKLDSQNQITIRKAKDSWSREEVIKLLNKLAYDLSGNGMLLNHNLKIKEKWIEENL